MILDAAGKPVRRVVGFRGGHFEPDESNASVCGSGPALGRREPDWQMRDSGWHQEPFGGARQSTVYIPSTGEQRRVPDPKRVEKSPHRDGEAA